MRQIPAPPTMFQSREPGFWFGELISASALSRFRVSQFQSREPGFWFGEATERRIACDLNW